MASGLTARQYAARIGVNHRTLSYWKYLLGREAREQAEQDGPASAPRFVEVASTMLSGGEPIEIVTAGGEVVRVPVGFDDDSLGRVLDVLAARR